MRIGRLYGVLRRSEHVELPFSEHSNVCAIVSNSASARAHNRQLSPSNAIELMMTK